MLISSYSVCDDIMELKQLFRRWQADHPNFMTPYILEIIQRGNTIIEISEGTGFEHDAIYGVSILDWNGVTFQTRMSGGQMFRSLAEARAYARTIF